MFTLWLTLLLSCVQFSIIAYLMYFFGVLVISLGAASIFFLAFETPFARVEKILVRTWQHISQIWWIDEWPARWVGCWGPLKDPRPKDRHLPMRKAAKCWLILKAEIILVPIYSLTCHTTINTFMVHQMNHLIKSFLIWNWMPSCLPVLLVKLVILVQMGIISS